MPRGEILVAIVNNLEDMRLAREAGWYRIPVTSAGKWLRDRWPPRWLAFYQTKVFGPPEAYAVNYYAVVRDIRTVSRMDLFPDTPHNHPKANRRYYQLMLDDLQSLAQPIVSRRWRRIVFIPTTYEKFKAAVEIKVMTTINRLGGLDHTTGVPVRYDPSDPLGPQQLGLFDPEI